MVTVAGTAEQQTRHAVPQVGPTDAELAAANHRVKELAETHRLRCYRDSCSDYNIPGQYGEIFCYGPGRLGVQVGGPRANQTETAITPAGANRVIARLRREGRWPVSQGGDGEAVFVVPAEDLLLAARVIRAYRKRSGGPSPEVRAKGLAAIRAWREAVQGAEAKPGAPTPPSRGLR